MLKELREALRSELTFMVATASAAVFVTLCAFTIFGFFGLALLGLATLFVAYSVELGDDVPMSVLPPPSYGPPDGRPSDRDGKAARSSEHAVLRHALFFVRVIGLCFLAVGAAGFVVVQMR